MATCDSCGAVNSAKKQFCTKCGIVLPVARKGIDISKNYDPATAFSKFDGGIFSGIFAGKTKAAKKEPQESSIQQKPTVAPTEVQAQVGVNEGTDNLTSIPTGTRAEVLKTVAKAASKAIFKSVALSLAVLGPGFVMLIMGITIPGMIWLFFGSFGLMAWTYRKPWRLGIVSCLIPPAAAGICYVVQLFLFGVASPPAFLLFGAIGAGIAVGYWRAQTHQVKQDENGSIIAERTIQYLLVWVAAYGITQFLGLVAAGTLAIRAGLITGAFSTAMLSVVSFVIWWRYRALVSHIAMIPLLALAGLIFPIEKAEAQSSSCASIFSQSDRSYRRLKRNCDSDFRKGIRDQALLKILAHKSSGRFEAYKKEQKAEQLVSFGGKANLLIAFDVYLQVYRAQVPDNLMLRRSILHKMINLGSRNRSQEMLQRIDSVAPELNALDMRICGAQSRGYSGLLKFSREKSNADWCLKRARAAVARAQQTANQPVGNNRMPSEPSTKVPDEGVGSGRQKIDPDPENIQPQPPGSREALLEQSTTAAAAVATVLIAAGIAVNVAQVIAAAIANALQAGVQLTTEEIQAAIADAIRNRDAKPSEGGLAELAIEPDTEPENNAPPNVTSTERVRPPTPIYDENGDPFDTNEQGQYLGPDDKGDWRWLSKSEAQESSAALKEKKSQLEGEQTEHDRQTEDNLERSSQKMRDKDDHVRAGEKREKERSTWWKEKGAKSRREHDAWRQKIDESDRRAEQERQDRESGVDPVEQRRRRQLETGILNSIQGMPPEEDTQDLMNRLAGASKSENRQDLENLWEQLRSERQAQVADDNVSAAQINEAAARAQAKEDRWIAIREGAKMGAKVGLGIATGGSASVMQAVGAGVIGSGTLITIGGIEQGQKAEGGKVTFDGWEATKGVARGTLDSADGLIGGVAAGGNKVISAGKTVFSGTSAYGRTYADTYEKTGSRDLASNRAGMAAAADALKTAAGEAFDEISRQTQSNSDAMKLDKPADYDRFDGRDWDRIVDGKHAANLARVDAAKTAGNIVGSTLTTIASPDKDTSTASAVAGSVWSEVKGRAAGKIVGSADHGGNRPLTDAQRATIDRWDAERAGTAKQPIITPDYEAHLAKTGKSTDDFVPTGKSLDDGGGFTSDAQRHVQKVVDSHGAKIFIRTVESEGSEAIANGQAVPKRASMKANTGKSPDELLGMDPAHKNRVVVFKPKLPERSELTESNGRKVALTDSEWEGLQNRAKLRQDQYDQYNEKLKNDPEYSQQGQLVIDKAAGLPITGDADGFATTGLYGEPLPKSVTTRMIGELIDEKAVPGKNTGSTFEHPEHLAWDISSTDDTQLGRDGKTDWERNMEINQRILDKIRPGGEPLAAFTGRPGVTPPLVEGAHYQGPGPKTE